MEQVRYIEKGVAEVRNHCETRKDCSMLPEIRSLQAKLNNVRTLSIELRSLAHIHPRSRRGLVDAIGSISKTLFGTLAANDLDIINKNIDKLFEEGNSLKTIVANQTALIKRILNNDVIQRLKQVDTGVTNELKTLNKNEITLIKVIALESSLSDLHFQIDEIFNLIILGKQGIISPQIIDPGTFINNYAQVLGSKTVGNAFIPKEENFQNILDISELTLFTRQNKVFFVISVPTVMDMEWDIEQIYPIPSLTNKVFLAPLVVHPIFLTSGLNYINVDQNYLDKQCRSISDFYICKQTQPIHDRRVKHDCNSEILSAENTVKFCKVVVYNIEDITFIPLNAENHFIAIPEKPIDLSIFEEKTHRIVRLEKPSLLQTNKTVDILYKNNHMRISGSSKEISYEIKIKTVNVTNDSDWIVLLNKLEKTPKLINDNYGYKNTLDGIEDQTNQLTFAHRIDQVESRGISILQIIGYLSIALICLYFLNKIGMPKLCFHLFCCKIKRNTTNNNPPASAPMPINPAPINIFTPILPVPSTSNDSQVTFDLETPKAKFHPSILKRKRNFED